MVAGESDDEEIIWVLALDGLVEVFETLELGRETAFRGRVYDEDDLAFEVGEGVGLAFLCRADWLV